MKLADAFAALAYKRLVLVDLPRLGSHQHELNGVAALREFFQTSEPVRGNISWSYFADGEEPLRGDGSFTFYDSRAKSADRTGRTEWRFYYTGDFLSHASEGDVLVLARTRNDRDLLGLVFQKDSGWLRAFSTLAPADSASGPRLVLPPPELSESELGFVEQRILEEIGVPVGAVAAPEDEEIAERELLRVPEKTLPEALLPPPDEGIAGRELQRAEQEALGFPSTGRMATLAWEHVDADIRESDATLVAWLKKEDEFFRAMEKILIDRRLKNGFESSEDFVSYANSVLNRRKSRMGLSLQNHLKELLGKHHLRFEAQALTEGKNKPDFLFPGEAEYHDPAFSADLLAMLAAKSTCKERWRQILAEADRIEVKHLCTLDTNLTNDQMHEMRVRRVVLVLPESFLPSYTDDQQKEIWTVERFIDFIREKQSVSA